MTRSRLLRGASWLVILLAVIDPAVPLTSRELPRVAMLGHAPPEHFERAVGVLVRALDGAAVVEPGPATESDAFVLVADRYPIAPLPTSAPLHVVAAGDRRSLRMTEVDVPVLGFLRLPVAVAVAVERRGTGPAKTALRLSSGGVVVATGEIGWSEGQRAARANLTYVPTAVGVIRLRVTAEAADGDAVADVLVDVRETRFGVHVASARPSWAVSFAATVLKADDRLSVSTRVGTGRGLAVRTEMPIGTNFSFRHMAETEIRPDRISIVGDDAGDAAALREAAERGRVVVIVPDRTLSPSLRELAGVRGFQEHVAAAPLRASNGLRASEWLLTGEMNPAATVRGAVSIAGRSYPLVVDTPIGKGRVVLVTALDAWRFRADPEYARFWRALVVELAAREAAKAQSLRVTPSVTPPGDPMAITYHAGSEIAAHTLPVHITHAGGLVRTITLVRQSGSRFAGRFHAPNSEGLHHVELAAADDGTIEAVPFAIARDAASPRVTEETALRALASAHRGTFVEDTDVETLARTLRDTLPAREAPHPARPMRWPGWGMVVAALLGVEWWARRRNGLR